MQLIYNLKESNPQKSPIALTIGNFDSVHMGHRHVLTRLKDIAQVNHIPCGVISFENHPYSVLHPEYKVTRICSLQHKILLLEQFGVDILILLKFTEELSKQSAETFLRRVHSCIPFSHLVLGHDAAFGKDRQGTREQIQKIGRDLHFEVEYVDAFQYHGKPVSSSLIKDFIKIGDLKSVEALLGRPYSILVSSKGESVFDVRHLTLPPSGVYPVHIMHGDQITKAHATVEVSLSRLSLSVRPPQDVLEVIF